MQLAKREKYVVTVGASALIIFFLFQLLISPFFDRKERLQKGIVSKKEDLKEIALLASEYKAHQQDSQEILQVLSLRKKGFTLFSFLDEAAGKAEVKKYIKYMKPSISKEEGTYQETMVEMKLEALTLEQLVRYLYRIEIPIDLIVIKRISIQANKREKGYLDAILQVMTYQQI